MVRVMAMAAEEDWTVMVRRVPTKMKRRTEKKP